MTLKGALLLLLTVSFTVCGQVLMKKGVNHLEYLSLKGALGSPLVLTGGLCYISGFLVWLNVLKQLPLSIAYPSSSFSFVLVLFASAIFLGETVGLMKILGVLFICTGVLFIGIAR